MAMFRSGSLVRRGTAVAAARGMATFAAAALAVAVAVAVVAGAEAEAGARGVALCGAGMESQVRRGMRPTIVSREESYGKSKAGRSSQPSAHQDTKPVCGSSTQSTQPALHSSPARQAHVP